MANPVHVSLWRQRQRMRVYLNEEKLFDLPRALAPGSKLNTLLFALRNDAGESDFCISNLRLAVGAPDTRNKLLTEGKWVTHGILFDVNSDRVKPESYGALKEIVNVLTENADVKIQVVGTPTPMATTPRTWTCRSASGLRARRSGEGVCHRGSPHGD